MAVRGKVTYEDGTPIAGHRVIVRFVPQVEAVDGKRYPRPAFAELQPDGTLGPVTTWKSADGVIPGVQKVLVQSLDQRNRPTGAVGREYGEIHNTPLSVEIKAGGPPVELTVAKPKTPRRP